MIELLMMQGARPSFSTKKLAKVNMPSTFPGLGKARVEICLEAKSARNLGHPTISKDNPTRQIPPRVATKDENHPM
jgi:hypothetical protein